MHNLKVPHGAHKGKRILGRGPSSGHGKTSTRGSKGQTSRSGRATYPGFEGGQTPIIRRIPKRGFTSVFKKVYQILNLDQLDKLGQAVITPELLEQKGLIKDKNKLIKILGDGEMKNAVTIRAHAFSKKAQDKLKASGSTVEVIRNA
ncbi:MAG: 50S ribosomal protein L15 [Candidatus Omnitrophica bacterium]|nr:50S ribosomal protein L15 [Candidatus Omnitrophota bacterium]